MVAFAEALLEASADVDALDAVGNTAMMWCLRNNEDDHAVMTKCQQNTPTQQAQHTNRDPRDSWATFADSEKRGETSLNYPDSR